MTRLFDYRHDFFPPHPVIDVILESPDTQLPTSRLAALIDTGADGTFVPVKLLADIRAPAGQTRIARSSWNERRAFSTFIIGIRISESKYPGVEVVGYDGEEIVLGRDVLNKLWLGLDGPQKITEVSETDPRRKRR